MFGQLTFWTSRGFSSLTATACSTLQEEWRKSGIENADADGIAVSGGTHRFVVAKNDCGSRAWGSSSLAVTGIVTTTSVSDALTDYNGKANTDAIINQDSNAVAARYARKTENFPSGKAGYLGVAGEWNIYYRSVHESILL